MTTVVDKSWETLDETSRRWLELQYRKELAMMGLPGLTEEGVEAYLRYRHERAEPSITTYEEGQIRRLMQRYLDPSRVPDPVDVEEHRGRLETFGATWFHLTNSQTYVAIMVTLNFLFVVALLLLLM